MANLRDIKNRINGIQNTAKITQAMQMVAASKLRRAQESIQSARPYFKKMNEILKNIINSVSEDYTHPLIRKSDKIENIVIIVIASDKGLCGSFNSNLIKFAENKINNDIKNQFLNADISLITVGKKVSSYFEKHQVPIISQFNGIFHRLNIDEAKNIINLIYKKFVDKDIDKVYVINNDFINLITQKPTIRTLLPIGSDNITLDITTGRKSIKSDVHKVEKIYSDAEYVFEPHKEELLNTLLPMNLEMQLWRALLESNAADNAARMMAMENATTNAIELIDSLQLSYNKARQAAITTEMLEIVSGAEALKNA